MPVINVAHTAPEDIFVELFAQVFGIENAGLLIPRFPIQDIYGTLREIDYAVRTREYSIAFEIDGLTWHHPAAISVDKFEDDLLRQNSLIHQGWRIFRWTDREILERQERVKEQLALFLESIPGLLAFDEFLPKQRGEILELRPHQEEALESLGRMREEGKSIALLAHAQGTGKTIVAITDAKRVGGRTLFLAHTRELVQQAYDKLRELWPERDVGRYFADAREEDKFNVVGSIQSVSENLNHFARNAFEYLIIDEAHHATAPSYGRVLAHFYPRFTLGLTATPERADSESVLETFRDCAHRLGLREAIALGELVMIRCVRVRTNIDLSKIRFNHVQYNRKDLEESLHRVVGERKYIPGALAVAPDAMLDAEQDALSKGVKPTAVIELPIWVRDYEEIDLFEWKEEVRDMYSVPALEMALGASEGRIKAALDRGEVIADHAVPLGERVHYYFRLSAIHVDSCGRG